MALEGTDICTFCSDLTTATSGISSFPPQRHHHSTYGSLSSSSATCPLCRFIACLWPEIDPRLFHDGISHDDMRNALDGFAVTVTIEEARDMESGITWAYLEARLISTQTPLRKSKYFTLVAHQSADSWSALQHRKDTSTTFDDKLKAVQDWTDRCRSGEEHTECRPTRFAPLRLLTVGHDGGPVRLVKRGPTAAQSEYTTLSYCWGSSPTLRTTKATLPIFTKEIPPAMLPKTFIDAIGITRGLGIPCIWIDALCIVQDDEEEWQREAACMADIYRGSRLTIAASESADASQGCFPDNNKPRFGDLSFYTRSPGRNALVRVYRGDLRNRGTVEGVINTRGWTLQEQLLSPRILFCIGSDAHWKCQASYRTESGLSFDPKRIHGGGSKEPQTKASPLDGQLSRTAWQRIVENYSDRVFTHRQDRIPAIAGVTRHLASTMDDQPILGLWAKSFAGDLAWLRSPGEPQMGDITGLPSWTWLACQGSVDYRFKGNYTDDEVEVVDRLELLNLDLEWDSIAYTSAVKRAQARVKGKMRHIRITPSAEGDTYNPPYLEVFGEKLKPTAETSLPWRCSGRFDNPDAWREGTFPCLLLFTVEYRNTPGFVQETFLILEPARDVKYKRVGLAKLRGSSPAFGSAETTSIVLV